ncbi:MAG: host attachment protein [Nannocystaceae bacterium]
MNLSPHTWILIADAARARIFAVEGPRDPWVAVDVEDHPEGRLRGVDLVSDRPGRSFHSSAPARSAMEPHTDPREVEAQRFARALAERALAGRREGAYESLVLVAPPRFLGHLRSALAPGVAERVSASIDADLTHFADGDLPAAIAHRLD